MTEWWLLGAVGWSMNLELVIRSVQMSDLKKPTIAEIHWYQRSPGELTPTENIDKQSPISPGVGVPM